MYNFVWLLRMLSRLTGRRTITVSDEQWKISATNARQKISFGQNESFTTNHLQSKWSAPRKPPPLDGRCYKKKNGRTLEWICSIRTLFVATCEESQQTKWNVARSVILMRSPDPVFLAARRRKCLKIAWKREKSNKYLHRTNQVNIHYWFVYRQKWPMAKELINHAENWMKLCRQTFYNS